ncbi:hypothetical protein KZP23_09785 [Echinicola marina]|uniref:DUF7009 family protein n=1 Tax=Echinicola marina TaxID=2859768 RepID=UPI001CF6C27C|nr:hypothetical protein [Echinicola marina]UCS95269.1 hypothetical protein KZP23_09785 [Echinicola marina]
MKLRINNNSIRLRLSQTEVKEIGKGNSVTENLYLGNNNLAIAYSLIPDEKTPAISAHFFGNELKVYVPKTLSDNWAGSEEVTMRHMQNEGDEHQNLILIEKDFQCLHKRPDEDESDSFPNPKSEEDYNNCN